jgi:hypothetical protein
MIAVAMIADAAITMTMRFKGKAAHAIRIGDITASGMPRWHHPTDKIMVAALCRCRCG